MGRKTKYCLNLAKRQHLNDKKSPSGCYCSACYEEVKERYARIEREGGPIRGLRAARLLAGGSFGYERTRIEKETNLRAFFHYVMPHIPSAQAEKMVKEIAKNSAVELPSHEGYKTVKMY